MTTVAIRTRARAVVTLLAAGALSFATSAPVWVRTQVPTPLAPAVDVEVSGSAAAPLVAAGAFVVLAGALALTLAGRVARWVALAAAALAGVAVVGGALGVLADPTRPARSAAAEVAGVTALSEPVTVTFWPWLTAAVGAAVVLVAVLAGLGARSWPVGSGRHDRPRGAGSAPSRGGEGDEPDAQEDWDALSRGSDPSQDS